MTSKRKQKKEQAKPMPAKRKKCVDEYTVRDLLQTRQFTTNAQNIIKSLKSERKAQAIKANMGGNELKRHPIDYLNLTPVEFVKQYAAILNKNCDLSANARYFIKAVGDDAAKRTIKQLREDETERNISDRSSKQ